MHRAISSIVLISTVLIGTGNCQEPITGGHDSHILHAIFPTSPTPWASQEDFVRVELTSHATNMVDASKFTSPDKAWSFSEQPIRTDLRRSVIRGQSPGGAGGSGAGAAEATDPSAILTQFQIQNVFTPSTYDASGYSNNLILQPVLPFPVAMPGLKEFFPAHIIRPTLPIISPTADPDGPLGVEGGLGDLTLLDVGVHPVEGFGTILLGYNAILPTSTQRQLGLGEWQLGPAGGLLYKQIPKTLLGVLVTTQYSFQSDAQQINVSPILVRHLPDEWYISWGDLFWTFDTETGNYDIPINVRLGKVLKFGNQPINVFVEPFYTPDGLRRGPAAEWGVKLNVTFLFPDVKLGPLLGHLDSMSDLLD